MAQPSPIQVWKSIVPWVVSAVKFGASALILSDIVILPRLQIGSRSVADAWCITVAVRHFFRVL
jgi:hypothetical protein